MEAVLAGALDTRFLEIGTGILPTSAQLFRDVAGSRAALVVADRNTFAAAGEAVLEAFRRQAIACREPFIYTDLALYAEHRYVEDLEDVLRGTDAVPVAVGSGTINDLTKLAAHRAGRPYVAVATAASMDGYTAFGASITCQGSKQTFACPAPAAVLADLEILAAAPPELAAAGYADLQAKVTAGADWIVADALGVEPLDERAWELVQWPLADALADPDGVRRGSLEAVRRLTEGLMLSGLAMQRTRTSRPASGAEHQFSHLWDMERHTHRGKAPAHGFKVGIATVAVAGLYERLLERPLDRLDVDACAATYPGEAAVEHSLRQLFSIPELREKAREETAAKRMTAEQMREHLQRVRGSWPALRDRLQRQLVPAAELRRRLAAAGAPSTPEEIGITGARLRESFRKAYHLRRRYTVLDLAVLTGSSDLFAG